MATVYKTAYSSALIIAMSVLITGVLLLSIKDYAIIGTVVILLCGMYAVYVYANFRYSIDNNVLQITCGALYSKKIDINEIRKVNETFSILNQPAGSFHRLEIVYKKFESIEISPKNREQFICELKAINPDIEIKRKK